MIKRFLLKAVLAMAGLVAFIGAQGAEPLSDYDKQELHRHEQCADPCQVKLDDSVFACMKGNQKDERDGTKTTDDDCMNKAYEKYRQCKSACPIDPRTRLQ